MVYATGMRPRGTAVELERRRHRAMRLLKEGRTLSAVARMVGAAASAVWQWRENKRHRGKAGLKAKPVPGRPPKLNARQRKRLPQVLLRGAQAYGYRTDLWTCARVAAVIEKEFGVRYHRAHVSRLLAQCGWSCQKPERRAVERDEEAIEHWKRQKWAAIKKSPAIERILGIPGRKRLHAHSHGTPYVGAAWSNPAATSSLSARPHLGDLGRKRRSAGPAMRSLRALPSRRHHPR